MFKNKEQEKEYQKRFRKTQHRKEYLKNYHKSHREKLINYYKQYRINHKKETTDWHLLKTYGLTYKEKELMIANQNYKCLSCGSDLKKISPKNIHIDHDHISGKIRGILCNTCNMCLGLLEENPDKIKLLMEYAIKIKYK